MEWLVLKDWFDFYALKENKSKKFWTDKKCSQNQQLKSENKSVKKKEKNPSNSMTNQYPHLIKLQIRNYKGLVLKILHSSEPQEQLEETLLDALWE